MDGDQISPRKISYAKPLHFKPKPSSDWNDTSDYTPPRKSSLVKPFNPFIAKSPISAFFVQQYFKFYPKTIFFIIKIEIIIESGVLHPFFQFCTLVQ